MPSPITRTADELDRTLLFILAFAVFIVLVIRNTGIYPSVFPDEYTYSKYSRLLSLSESVIPGYLYLGIYRITNICGDGFLDCARVLNVFFFSASAPFIYLTTRRICKKSTALFVTALALSGPVNTYTIYFMPEALYFFSLWVLSWFVLGLDSSSGSTKWSIAGILLGLVALVKPHALFLIPAILLYFIIVLNKENVERKIETYKNISLFVSFIFFTKFFLGYLFAGKAGLTLSGSFYTNLVGSSLQNIQYFLDVASLSYENFVGHFLALCLLFGLPLAATINLTTQALISQKPTASIEKVSLYTSVLLLTLLPLVAIFTASAEGMGNDELNARLHVRFYNYAFPLLIIIAASRLSLETRVSFSKSRVLLALLIGAICIYAVYTKFEAFTPNYLESPELRGLTFNTGVFYFLAALSLLSLFAWAYHAQMGARIFIYIFMPLVIIFSNIYVNREIRYRLVPDVFDKAGLFTKHYLADDQLEKLAVGGENRRGLILSLFHIDTPQATIYSMPLDDKDYFSELPHDRNWILLFGENSLTENTYFQIRHQGFTLARIHGSFNLDFSKFRLPGFILKTRGLSSTEGWGRWSLGKTTVLEFKTSLPEEFTVKLEAAAFGPNVGKDILVHVGNITKSFVLDSEAEEIVLSFHTDGHRRKILFDIPSPASPKELAWSEDQRKLGIAFFRMNIEQQ